MPADPYASTYFAYVDTALPAMRGEWAGGSREGVFAGWSGFCNLVLARRTEGFAEFPQVVDRPPRFWFRYVRQHITCEGFELWLNDWRSTPTRLVCRWSDAQTFLATDGFGGSGVFRLEAEALVPDNRLTMTQTGFTIVGPTGGLPSGKPYLGC
jgi:hypothetical protein